MPGFDLNTLVCHPATSAATPLALAAGAVSSPAGLTLRFRLTGDPQHLLVPPPSPPEPGDGLWQHTCCEAFIAADDSPEYREFNFSPSGRWAIYRFADYRKRDDNYQAPTAPRIAFSPLDDGFLLEASISRACLPASTRLHLGLTAVIENTDGSKSYWALTHGGPTPDFHLRQSFTLTLSTP